MLDCDPDLNGFYSRFGFDAKQSLSMIKKNPR